MEKLKFKKLAFQWLESTTINAYQNTLSILEDNFVKNSTKGNIKRFLAWWDARRCHWSRAYKTDIFAPTTNQVEVANASLTHARSINLTLLNAAKEDVSDSIMQEALYRQYQKGVNTTGVGPSFEQKMALAREKQKKCAERLVEEINNFGFTGNGNGLSFLKKKNGWPVINMLLTCWTPGA